MVRRIEVQLLDDIDGSHASETVSFSLDGRHYEIDLNSKHAEKLRSSLGRYVEAATKIDRVHRTNASRARRAGTPARTDREQNRAIRDWAQRKGIELSSRGRIPQSIVEQYQAEAGR
jgi:hypothetical protein